MTEPRHFTDWRNIEHDDSVSDKSNRVLPDGGIPIDRASDQRRTAIAREREMLEYQPSKPPASPARTTWLTWDAPERRHRKLDRLHRLQHGRGHTYEDFDGQRVHQSTADQYIRCDALLQQCKVNDPAKSWALKKVMTEDLRGFSGHYEGADGAAIGFALLAQYDDPEVAKTSHIADAAESILSIDTDALVKYMFRKWT